MWTALLRLLSQQPRWNVIKGMFIFKEIPRFWISAYHYLRNNNLFESLNLQPLCMVGIETTVYHGIGIYYGYLRDGYIRKRSIYILSTWYSFIFIKRTRSRMLQNHMSFTLEQQKENVERTLIISEFLTNNFIHLPWFNLGTAILIETGFDCGIVFFLYSRFQLVNPKWSNFKKVIPIFNTLSK